MRYYDIVITPVQNTTNASYGEVTTVSTTKRLRFTTHPNGLQSAPDMGALAVTIDAPVVTFDSPVGAAYIEISGIDIQTIAQASNLQGAQITVSAGMGNGLPLAKPEQAGVILQGSVFQSFGNWTDTNMALSLMIQPFTAPINADSYPKIIWHWQKGQDIKDAIQQAIVNSFPGYSCDFTNVRQTLVAGSPDAGFYKSITNLAQIIKSASQAAVPDPTYPGIRCYVNGKVFHFYDTSSVNSPKEIQFEDFIGQPTWVGPENGKIVFQTVMRADIMMGDVITMPFFNQPGSRTTAGYGSIVPSSQSIQSPKDRSLFTGNFEIVTIRHLGNSRSPTGDAWMTIFEAVKIV